MNKWGALLLLLFMITDLKEHLTQRGEKIAC